MRRLLNQNGHVLTPAAPRPPHELIGVLVPHGPKLVVVKAIDLAGGNFERNRLVGFGGE